MSPDQTEFWVATTGVLIIPPTFSTLTSATFAVLDLISNLWTITSPPLSLIFSSLLKLRCLWQLTAVLFLFPPTFSILNFKPKLAVAYMCATI